MNHAVNWEAISAIGQIVGAIAVVVSLIYLAMQVRSSARETRRAAMRSTLDVVVRFTQQITAHPDLAEVWNRGLVDFESLEGVDRTRFNSYMHAMFRTVEDAYYHVYEIRPRKDKRGVDLISDALPFGRLWYDTPDHAIGYAEHFSRSHHGVIRVYDESGDVIEAHEHKGDFKES